MSKIFFFSLIVLIVVPKEHTNYQNSIVPRNNIHASIVKNSAEHEFPFFMYFKSGLFSYKLYFLCVT